MFRIKKVLSLLAKLINKIMNTKYTSNKRIASPYQPAIKRDVFNVSMASHPVREIINACVGSFALTATFVEDRETVTKLENPSIIAFLCTIRKGDKIIGIGRGHTALSPTNKFVERNIFSALNFSLIDAISKCTRVLNTFHTGQDLPLQSVVEPVVGKGYNTKDSYNADMISDKQKSYLQELINVNLDGEERESAIQTLDDLTRTEASEMIQSFKN